METQKFEFLLKKVRNWILTCILTCSERAEITSASSISVLDYSNWYINGKVFTSSLSWAVKNLILLRKSIDNFKQFIAYTVHFDWCYHSIHKHSSRSQPAPIWWHRGCIVVPSRVDIYFRNLTFMWSQILTPVHHMNQSLFLAINFEV